MRYIFICLLWVSFFIWADAQPTQKINIHNVSSFIGSEGTVCDSVYSVNQPTGENKPIYIDFGGKYPDNIFSVVIFHKDQSKFNFDLKEVLKRKHICVTGKITEYKGKPQIIINEAVQLLVQE